jgi:hypothetical protein
LNRSKKNWKYQKVLATHFVIMQVITLTYWKKHPNVVEELKGRIDDYGHRHDFTGRN